ncbi:esterase-like activity of phytase family protein [Phycisphaerales bacterium AB-hyl4]|uniref:Esterase-like activity of phytase family protein n=1 Tax=Natronomicrosphaera hydrolytica TaxID=3242702 RepID=A0ABV4U3T0_9BACT
MTLTTHAAAIRLHPVIRTRLFLTVAAVMLALLSNPAGLLADDLSIVYRGTFDLPGSTTDQHGNVFDIDGLSGITWTGGNNYWAVMDNSDKLVQLQVDLSANGSIASASVAGGLTLAHSRDHEGIAYTNPQRNSVFISDENRPMPGVREYSLANGALMQTVSIPSVFSNIRSNYGFESLTRQPNGQVMWTANEEALTVDGSLSSTSAGSVVRLQQFDVDGNNVAAGPQYAYITNPVHRSTNDDPTQTGARSRSGLVELVAMHDGRLLALERSFAQAGIFNLSSAYRNSIFLIDLNDATDVSDMAGLIGQNYTPASKSLLWSATRAIDPIAPIDPIGNLEGLTLGPQLPNGNWSLLGIVDWSDPIDLISANRLVAFELIGVIPEPGTAATLLTLAGFTLLRRRRHTACPS